MSEGGPKMLRMVRWQGIIQDADRLRNYADQDVFEIVSRIVHMGDPRTAKAVLLDWAEAELQRLRADPHATAAQLNRLHYTYLEMRAKIDGRAFVMDTELGYYSQNVGPDSGRTTHEFLHWANPGNLRYMFDEGHEVMLTGHMGTGKSHLAVLFMEYLLTRLTRPTVHVVTNISGIEDTSGEYSDRIHHVTLLSEVLRIWTRLPAGCLIVLVIDEPESNLRGGTSKNVRMFQDFRYMLRKLGMSKLEIWHTEAEQYKAIREENSEHVTRITKTDKDSCTVQRVLRGEAYSQEVHGVHELGFLRYAHRGMASIDVDVQMSRILRRVAKLHRTWDMKQAVREALEDDATYTAEFRQEERKRAPRTEDEKERIIQEVLADAERYLTKHRTIDPLRLRVEYELTFREARALAGEATRRFKAQGEES